MAEVAGPGFGRLARRLWPLHVAAFLQAVSLWVPVEKLFMTEIGFDAGSIGVMAAAYAAVVPLLEIPSGILADRWSRRGVLMLASVALVISVTIGGLSNSVTAYVGAALFLGAFFALYSGTLDSVVYDTVLEETGTGEDFERRIGRVRLIESIALVSSALAGGWLATVTSSRSTYFVTVPFTALSLVALAAFREPRLHRSEQPMSLRTHIATTYRTMLQRGRLISIVTLMVLTSLLVNVLMEFGPLWLLALGAPTVLYGPHWAGLTSAFGFGGTLAGKLRFTEPGTVGTIVVSMIVASVVLRVSHNAVVVTLAQVVMAMLIVTAGIYLTGQLHHEVPSSVRSGVASGVGTLTSIVFLPFGLVFGQVAKGSGVHVGAWMVIATTVLAAGLLARLALTCPPGVPAPTPRRFGIPLSGSAGTVRCQPLHEELVDGQPVTGATPVTEISEPPQKEPNNVNWTLEVVVVPVSDVDRAKAFYADQLGFHVDHDTKVDDANRVVQLTPTGSGCSVVIGKGLVPHMTPGSIQGLQLVVADLHAARAELLGRGVDVGEIQVTGPTGLRPSKDGEQLDNVGFMFFRDPDGNRWAVQQISGRGQGGAGD
jgi:MFS family permease/catechol 2,3-dioxygenase-like lactoylglutathione lyase family enzyme